MTTRFDPPFVLLEDRIGETGAARLFSSPRALIQARTTRQVGAAMAGLERELGSGRHVAGYIAYEAFGAFEPRLAEALEARDGGPLLWFGVFDEVTILEPGALDEALCAFGPPPPLGALCAAHDQARHGAKVREVLRLIGRGDLYQVNLTFPLRFRYEGDPLALYAALRARQPVAHGAIVATGEQTLLSVSPELFVQRRGEGLTVRPMKGTAARGRDASEDAAIVAALQADPKCRAENLMITDLLRNDLSRVCTPGSVRTPSLFAVETYPTFHALTSTVVGRLARGQGLVETISALFPCGSVVGAPKIRAAEVIADLEATPRGAYTGAVGHASPDGGFAFSVAIRTAVLSAGGEGVYGVGGGIVADSDPQAEYEEALLKGQVLVELASDFGLIETLRWRPTGGFVRLERHLARLARSAAALGFASEPEAWSRRLRNASVGWSGDQDLRVRLELSRDGAVAISQQPAAASPERLRVRVSRRILDAADPFLRHKTTRRRDHDAAFAEAAAAGLDEALLLDRQGRVADASRNSVFVLRDGRLLTPAVASGALPGVLRAELIEDGRAVEAELRPEDLAAGPFFLGNSLHGLRRAHLV